ncbi:hypothetical protein [Achromobacter deleyi]|uniref:hypothetical protein n=1 Tax=Achromobacter deleyi TaxID=1353891 RepID=UPI00149171B1|nr:hypothetical protein [Achromobacter deleyi]QVQ28320.1 hypothetical protein HLG70_07880 [Achromobacter deleyi]
MDELNSTATSRPPVALTSGERCAQRTLAAAEQLLNPARPSGLPSVSSIEAELARYVKEAYRPRTYG